MIEKSNAGAGLATGGAITRDLPETLIPVAGEGVPGNDYRYPSDTTPSGSGPPGTAIDITSHTMPEEGAFEVHDTDEERLEAERINSEKTRHVID